MIIPPPTHLVPGALWVGYRVPSPLFSGWGVKKKVLGRIETLGVGIEAYHVVGRAKNIV